MTSLTGRKPGVSYTELLKLDNSTITSSLQRIQDGAGNDTPISISTTAVSLNSIKLSDVADPTLPQDAATKNYVDTTTTANPIYVAVAGGTMTGNLQIGGQAWSDTETLTDAASISWNLNNGNVATVTLGGNRTLSNPTNMKNGGSYTIIVKQDGTGNRTLAYGSAYKWAGGTVPVLSTAANAVDIICFVSDGTNMYGSIQKGFA